MSPATFKSLREGLGLTSAEVAQHLGVDVRTVQRWESTHPPSLEVVAWIEDLAKRFHETKEMVLGDLSTSLEARGEPDVVSLTRYQSRESYLRAHGREGLPHSVHNALISALTIEMSAQGFDVEVSFSHQER